MLASKGRQANAEPSNDSGPLLAMKSVETKKGNKMEKKFNHRRGQGLVEYVALTALVAIVCIGTVKVFGSKVTRHLNSVSNKFDKAVKKGLNARVANPYEEQ